MKKYIAGVLTGVVLSCTVALAASYTANDNPFPIQLNGQNVSIEGYNINDNTYFKLRDIADVVGGFDVDFQNDTILLSKDGYVYDNTAPTPSAAETSLKAFAATVTGVSNADLGVTYSNVRFKLVDFSGDGVPELLAVGINDDNQIAQAEVFYYNNGDIVSIFNDHCLGYDGGSVYPIIFDGTAYMCGDSYSSSTGFFKNLIRYNGEWQTAQFSCIEYDYETGQEKYIVNDNYVSDADYDTFNEKIQGGVMRPSDFVPANQL